VSIIKAEISSSLVRSHLLIFFLVYPMMVNFRLEFLVRLSKTLRHCC